MTKTYDNIIKIAKGQGDDYTTGFNLDYFHFKDHYKMIPIDLSKQQINFTANLDRWKWKYGEMEIQQCSLLLKKQN